MLSRRDGAYAVAGERSIQLREKVDTLEPPVAKELRVERCGHDGGRRLAPARGGALLLHARGSLAQDAREMLGVAPRGVAGGAGGVALFSAGVRPPATRAPPHSRRPSGQRILWNSRYHSSPGYPCARDHTCADALGSRTSANKSW